MRYCIVNGDDLGASSGINRGILEAHRRGILTSASLMVDMPAAGEAASVARDEPRLSVGLHAQLTNEGGAPVVDFDDPRACGVELRRQLRRFAELMGRPPTHLDAHHNVHRDPRLLPHFLRVSRECARPLREHSPVRYFSSFYGRWDGETHPEQISPERLLTLLEAEVGEGVTELGCHPGYVDPGLASAYSVERETELQTLCDLAVRAGIEALEIRLVGFGDLGRLLAGAGR